MFPLEDHVPIFGFIPFVALARISVEMTCFGQQVMKSDDTHHMHCRSEPCTSFHAVQIVYYYYYYYVNLYY